jgi:hypothetical protein
MREYSVFTCLNISVYFDYTRTRRYTGLFTLDDEPDQVKMQPKIHLTKHTLCFWYLKIKSGIQIAISLI